MMKKISNVIIGLVALAHIWFLVLEMFLWQSSIGLNTFGLTPEFASASAALAANQGLYNGFLAAGLIYGLFHPDGKTANTLKTFFLLCIVVAGVYGAITAKTSILFVQALPAALGLIALRLSKRD